MTLQAEHDEYDAVCRELLPCPFCGGKPELAPTPEQARNEGSAWGRVRCRTCGRVEQYVEGVDRGALGVVAAKWNTRGGAAPESRVRFEPVAPHEIPHLYVEFSSQPPYFDNWQDAARSAFAKHEGHFLTRERLECLRVDVVSVLMKHAERVDARFKPEFVSVARCRKSPRDKLLERVAPDVFVFVTEAQVIELDQADAGVPVFFRETWPW